MVHHNVDELLVTTATNSSIHLRIINLNILVCYVVTRHIDKIEDQNANLSEIKMPVKLCYIVCTYSNILSQNISRYHEIVLFPWITKKDI